MKKNCFILAISIILAMGLFFVFRLKNNTFSRLEFIPNMENFNQKNIEIEIPHIEMTLQETLTVPRILHFYSEDENLASTMHYVTAPESLIFTPRNFTNGVFFNSIIDFSKLANWPPLWEVGVPSGSLEIRIWMYFGMQQSVVRIYRQDGKWQGFYTNYKYRYRKPVWDGEEWKLERIENHLSHPPFVSFIKLTPQTNWENLWKKIERQGVLNLQISPDNDKIIQFDGVRYFIEINDGLQYRIFNYADPKRQERPETEQFMEIMRTLHFEFLQSLPTHATLIY